MQFFELMATGGKPGQQRLMPGWRVLENLASYLPIVEYSKIKFTFRYILYQYPAISYCLLIAKCRWCLAACILM